ncbi:MAG: prephenate dehydratase [Candidatus Sericytochromatia bacterium]
MSYESGVKIMNKKIAIQGFRASFHEIAANKFFGKEIAVVMCETFKEVFNSLERQEVNFGVVAIENTVAGSILPNYALLRDYNVNIIGEVYLRIQQNLMALPNQKIEELTEVRSHQMALLQCQDFFETYYPNIKLAESTDTALSAKEIREKNLKGIGAIASLEAAEAFDLEVLAESIETNKRNYTRFLIIKENEDINENNCSKILNDKANKASICFNLSHKSGSLANILISFASLDINLTKIQSLPVLGREWEYFFHLDLEFNDYFIYKKALEIVNKTVNELTVLGEYLVGEKYL